MTSAIPEELTDEMTFSQNNSTGHTMWVKLQRFTRRSRRQKLFFAAWISMLVVATIVIYQYRSYLQHNITMSKLGKRLIYYCNPPGPVLGNEMQEPMEYAQFELKQVQVVVRHGDRSSIASKFPFSNFPDFNCELKTQNGRDLQKIKHLRDMEKRFQKVRMRSNHKQVKEDFWLDETEQCKHGQLTSNGYLQHLYIGEHMYNSYGRKLDITIGTVEEQQILVFATPVERTHQSAAAFIAGMLQSVYQKMESSESFPKINIQISPDRLGVFREDENGNIPPCLRLHEIIQRSKETRSYQKRLGEIEPLMEKFSHIFNVSRNKLPPITWIGDLIVTHHCHKHIPLCGPYGCVDDKIKAETMRTCDWAFTSKFSPPAEILSHPMLSKIVQRMMLKVSGEQHTKFVLYSAHDSTVIPILEYLGIFSKQWVPYAMRVVFELWEAGGLVASKLEGDDMDKHFIRILVNGKDYTRKIRMCKDSLKFAKLCPLKSLLRVLEGSTENMGEQYTKLCKTKQQ